MSYSIVVRTEENGNPIYQNHFLTQAEFKKVSGYCVNYQVGRIAALFIPLKTDNLANTSQSLFYPSTGHPLSCIVNVITLPFRFVTLIPRAIYSYFFTLESHPLHRYLTALQVDGLGRRVFVELKGAEEMEDNDEIRQLRENTSLWVNFAELTPDEYFNSSHGYVSTMAIPTTNDVENDV